MSFYLNYNGDLVKTDQPVIKADNRGLRYGDGLFETMRLKEGQIWLASGHFERLFEGMRLLEFNIPTYFTETYLQDQIMQLCKKNGLEKMARLRLMVFRGSGGLYDLQDHIPQFIIEASELNTDSAIFNEQGWLLGIYTNARKTMDHFSGLKTNNYLPYVMAALHARKQGWNDCLLTNTNKTICDTTIANVFIIRGDNILTPSLTEGCVAGVMRKHLLAVLPDLGYNVTEGILDLTSIKEADELFVSNSVIGIRWVRQCGETVYTNKESFRIYNEINR